MNAQHEMTRIRVLRTEITVIERRQRRIQVCNPTAVDELEKLEGKRARRIKELNERVTALRRFRLQRWEARAERDRQRARLHRSAQRGTLCADVMAR